MSTSFLPGKPVSSPPCVSVSISSPLSSSLSSVLNFCSPNSVKVGSFSSSGRKPRSLLCFKIALPLQVVKGRRGFQSRVLCQKPPCAGAGNMTVTEFTEEAEEPLFESKIDSRPRRIALFVEPSPFSWVFVLLLLHLIVSRSLIICADVWGPAYFVIPLSCILFFIWKMN